MFPKILDGAKVLYYTMKDDYGVIRYPDGEIAETYQYCAICKYSQDENYYLFCCNKNYEVVGDSVWSSIGECMKVATSYSDNLVWKTVE